MPPIGKGSLAHSLVAAAKRGSPSKVVRRESKAFANPAVVVDVEYDNANPPEWLKFYRFMQRRCAADKDGVRHTMAAEWLKLSVFQRWYEQSYLTAPSDYVLTWIFGEYDGEAVHYGPQTLCWIPPSLHYWSTMITMADGVNLRRKNLGLPPLLPGATPSRLKSGGFRVSACNNVPVSDRVFDTEYNAHRAWVSLRLEELRVFIRTVTLEPTLTMLKRRAKLLEYELLSGEIVWKL